MTELVRAGKIYIAQPPLYQIKRKKREEYVDDDVQLNKILISLGAEDVRLKNLADDKEVTAAQLKDILESLEKLAKLSESVRRHGGDFESFPRASAMPRRASCRPIWSKCAKETKRRVHYFHDEKAVREFHEENPDLNLVRCGDSARNCLPLGDCCRPRPTAPAAAAASWSSCTNPRRSKNSSQSWPAKG